MASLPSLRASDADRENVAVRLRHAVVEGRLSADELEERLEALYRSRTYGELDALVADLPVSHSPLRPRVRVARWVAAVGALTLLVAMLGMRSLARLHSAVAVTGAPHRQIRFPGPFPSPGRLPNPHPDLIAMASMAGVLALLVACAALIWVLMRSRSTSDA